MTEHVEEEDWSAFLSGNTSITGFAQHELHSIRISSSLTLDLECVSNLSPLDMMNLWNGSHDATGHKIWMGALFFVEVIARRNDIQEYFRNKNVLELGCGTGIAGLTLLLSRTSRPSFVQFTDSDSSALDLCRGNCRRNLAVAASPIYDVSSLDWGLSDKKDIFFDTILATDVLYDIASLSPLLSTVKGHLRVKGFFLLAHVPRASLPGDSSVSHEDLERYIIQQANIHGLVLIDVIRPSNLASGLEQENGPLNEVSFVVMQDAGAAILVLQNADQHLGGESCQADGAGYSDNGKDCAACL